MKRLREDPREAFGAILFGGAIVAAMVLAAIGVNYGWGVGVVWAAFIAGALLIQS